MTKPSFNPSPEPALPSPLTDTAPRAQVLVVDDEVGLRDVLSYGLKKRGFEITCAANGQEALQLAQTKHFDLAVCDIMMPGENGVTVLDHLKRLSPATEVIMVTGFATLETAVDSMRKGAYDYISKPFNVSKLGSVLEKALEHQQLKARVNHLEEVNRMKSEFMSVVSHELRTPLACIMGFVTLVLDGVYGEVVPTQVDPLNRVVTSSQNLLQLINNILDFSKLTANRMTLAEDRFECQEIAREVLGTLEPLAVQKSLTLTLDAGEPLWLSTDRTKFKEVLINLLGNAIKFTSKGGANLRILPASDAKVIRVEVSDTGIGIKEEDLPRLFQEFGQIDSSTTRRFGGTGLGLCISKKIIELMGGTIQIESKVGVGSTVRMELPIRASNVAPGAISLPPLGVPVPLSPQEKEKKILLSIDDDPMSLKLLADSLDSTGLRIVGAQSGQEGMALARKLHPQMITLDIMMPHMDGWSVLQALKADPELRDIPVYIVSIVDNKPLALSLGVHGYILKPFTRPQLLEQLKLSRNSADKKAA